MKDAFASEESLAGKERLLVLKSTANKRTCQGVSKGGRVSQAAKVSVLTFRLV